MDASKDLLTGSIIYRQQPLNYNNSSWEQQTAQCYVT